MGTPYENARIEALVEAFKAEMEAKPQPPSHAGPVQLPDVTLSGEQLAQARRTAGIPRCPR